MWFISWRVISLLQARRRPRVLADSSRSRDCEADYIHNPIRQILLHPSTVWHQFGSRDISEDYEWDHIWHQRRRLLLRRYNLSFSDNRRAHSPPEPGQEETSRRQSAAKQWQVWILQEWAHFLGHIINKDGVKPDQLKVEAIVQMPQPTDVSELKRYLGMVNYLGRYLRKLHGSGVLHKQKRSPTSRHCWLQHRLWPTLTPPSQPL